MLLLSISWGEGEIFPCCKLLQQGVLSAELAKENVYIGLFLNLLFALQSPVSFLVEVQIPLLKYRSKFNLAKLRFLVG